MELVFALCLLAPRFNVLSTILVEKFSFWFSFFIKRVEHSAFARRFPGLFAGLMLKNRFCCADEETGSVLCTQIIQLLSAVVGLPTLICRINSLSSISKTHPVQLRLPSTFSGRSLTPRPGLSHAALLAVPCVHPHGHPWLLPSV